MSSRRPRDPNNESDRPLRAGRALGPRQRGTLQPDELDLQIIALLRVDGRRSNREVARQLNVPEATVRYRVRRLTDSGILRISALVDPEQLGFGLTAVISLNVEPGLFVTISEMVAAMDPVMWLGVTTGSSDIILTASFRDQDSMFTFIAEDLASIEGIRRVETSVCLRVVKRDSQWSTDLTNAMVHDAETTLDLDSE